jgi:hypothetical protein
MFREIFNKLHTFADHHQLCIALFIGFCIICVTWGVEKLLEEYIFTKKSFFSYIVAVLGGLLLLWVAQHCILHVI